MFCSVCGKELPDNAKFCGVCGANVENPTQTQTPIGTQQTPPQNFVQSPPSQTTTKPNTQANIKAEISKIQTKLDNSNSTLIKGRSIWDIVGICAVVLMIICFFLPSLTSASYNISLASIMTLVGSSSYTAQFSGILLIYLLPAVFSAIDLIVTRENSTRHVRLIILGALNALLQFSISGVGQLAGSFVSASALGIGFYLNMFASLIIIAVGIIGIYEKKKGKIAA